MELKAGYKITEIGIIPFDWEVMPFKKVTNAITCGIAATPQYVTESLGKPFLSASHVQNGKVIADDFKFISIELYNQITKNNKPEKGDILYTRVGAGIGEAGVIEVNFDFAIYVSLTLIKPKKILNSYFLKSLLNSNYYRFLANRDQFAGGGVQNLNVQVVREFPIPIPPIEEQTAIATALSDADALINSLEKLIAKKRNIKQGAMQKLLQPKEDWIEKSIFEIAENKKELFDDGDWVESEHITDKGIRLIQTGNIGIGHFIEKENKKYIYKESFEKLGCKELKVGDLLICRLAEPAGRACVLPFIGEEKVITSVDVTIFRPRKEIANRQFLNQVFSTSIWFNSISDLCGGTTHKRISRGALGRIKILLPTIEEQNQISAILSDMDTEIIALEIKLQKYRNIKLGMMQNLLTGKIRLV